MIEIGIVNLLNSTTSLTNIVGSRIYPVQLPVDPVIPAVAFKLIGSQSYSTFQTTGFQRKRFEFSCYSNTYLQALEIKKQVIVALDNYAGVLSDGSFVSSTQQITGTDLYIDDNMSFCSTVEFYFGFVYPTA